MPEMHAGLYIRTDVLISYNGCLAFAASSLSRRLKIIKENQPLMVNLSSSQKSTANQDLGELASLHGPFPPMIGHAASSWIPNSGCC